MTVSSQLIVAGPFLGNGSTTAFPFTMQGIAADEVTVLVDGAEISSSLYSVLTTGSGGTVTFTTAPVNGASVLIISAPSFEQTLALQNNGPFLPRSIETAFDRDVARALWLKAMVEAISPADSLVPGAGLGKFVARDADGNATWASGTGNDSDLRSDLADSGGGSLVGVTQDIDTPTQRSLITVIRDRPWMLEDKGGGPDKTPSENTAARAAILAQFDAVTSRGVLQYGPGEYQFDDNCDFPTYARFITMQGEGVGRTTLRQMDDDKNGINLPNGLNHSLLLRDFTLQGAGSSTSFSGTGIGIYQPYNGGANDSFGLHFENIVVTNFGSHSIELLDTFTTSFERVQVNYCGGYGFIVGGNTLRMESCYVHNLASGQVGYRIFDGNATLIACNGIDAGDYWGRFGRSTLEANDLPALGANADALPFVSIYGCNVEDYASVGLDLWNGVLNIDPTTNNTSKASATGVIGVRTRSNSGRGFMGAQPGLGSGGSWANGYGLHSADGNNPFALGLGVEDGGSITYWDELNSLARTSPLESMTEVALSTYSKLWSHTRVTGSLGFATGAGGTVTQGTNKSTAVELNKSTGEITMNNATLNAATIVSFTLTNSTIVAADQVVVQHISGGTVGAYTVTAAAGSGAATVYVRNNTAGNLGEALVLKFSVIKAVTS